MSRRLLPLLSVVVCLAGGSLLGQTPTFEVASVKPSEPVTPAMVAAAAVSGHLADVRPLLAVGDNLLDRFLQATRTGDMDGLLALLARDVVLHSDGGGKAVADEGYLRESIKSPAAKVVRGYEKSDVAMPTYEGLISDAQIESLILYLKTIR